jgi:predicted GNAT superfamily acetyltransferase
MTRTPSRPAPLASPGAATREAAIRQAAAAAQAAARRSGIEIRELEATTELQAASRLLTAIWEREQTTIPLLKALAKTGNYVAGAFAGGRMVGAAFAFFAAPPLAALHSHVAGVSDDSQARSVGYALKLHQRSWALSRHTPKITWTFDPLVRRNAYFNLVKLGARVVAYLPDFYGEMLDQVNAGDESDRVLIEWDLLAPGVVAACDFPGTGGPGAPGTGPPDGDDGECPAAVLAIGPDGAPRRGPWRGQFAIVEIPANIERLRSGGSPLAGQWRRALREVLGEAMAGGAQVVGFRRAQGYILAAAGALPPGPYGGAAS